MFSIRVTKLTKRNRHNRQQIWKVVGIYYLFLLGIEQNFNENIELNFKRNHLIRFFEVNKVFG